MALAGRYEVLGSDGASQHYTLVGWDGKYPIANPDTWCAQMGDGDYRHVTVLRIPIPAVGIQVWSDAGCSS